VYHKSVYPNYCALEQEFHERNSVRSNNGCWLSPVLSPPWRIQGPWPSTSVERAGIVRTKQIAIGYEYRRSDHHNNVVEEDSGIHADKVGALKEVIKRTAQEGAQGTISYCLKSIDGRKGEVGLINSNNWALAEPEELRMPMSRGLLWRIVERRCRVAFSWLDA
jgi:hypothetical protein